eukprot:CAMPEP_0196599262 /NCGR_PEP_ID=MMETSP1081-20130531/94766_1 /TAXON_ID=36882 /ORGANISM="Pyramimonas amylifera, Strain CCMP720" /LENGTH=440 /DNA_ID=CAMNT_0041925025 /DNA_START=671 /DNA_END=1994 /DNA_ORIENTATION=-
MVYLNAGGEVCAWGPQISSEDALAALLVLELRSSKKSPWSPYLRRLITLQPPCLVLGCLPAELLGGSGAAGAVEAEMEELRNRARWLMGVLAEERREEEEPAVRALEEREREAVWALCVAERVAVSLPASEGAGTDGGTKAEVKGIAPVLDWLSSSPMAAITLVLQWSHTDSSIRPFGQPSGEGEENGRVRGAELHITSRCSLPAAFLLPPPSCLPNNPQAPHTDSMSRLLLLGDPQSVVRGCSLDVFELLLEPPSTDPLRLLKKDLLRLLGLEGPLCLPLVGCLHGAAVVRAVLAALAVICCENWETCPAASRASKGVLEGAVEMRSTAAPTSLDRQLALRGFASGASPDEGKLEESMQAWDLAKAQFFAEVAKPARQSLAKEALRTILSDALADMSDSSDELMSESKDGMATNELWYQAASIYQQNQKDILVSWIEIL